MLTQASEARLPGMPNSQLFGIPPGSPGLPDDAGLGSSPLTERTDEPSSGRC